MFLTIFQNCFEFVPPFWIMVFSFLCFVFVSYSVIFALRISFALLYLVNLFLISLVSFLDLRLSVLAVLYLFWISLLSYASFWLNLYLSMVLFAAVTFIFSTSWYLLTCLLSMYLLISLRFFYQSVLSFIFHKYFGDDPFRKTALCMPMIIILCSDLYIPCSLYSSWSSMIFVMS